MPQQTRRENDGFARKSAKPLRIVPSRLTPDLKPVLKKLIRSTGSDESG